MRLRGSRYTEGESTLLNFKVSPTQHGLNEVLQNLCCHFIALIPRGRVRGLDTSLPTTKLEGLLVTMPNIEALGLLDVLLSEGLQPKPEGPRAGRKLLPSLRSKMLLRNIILVNHSWRPLATCLAHQASDGHAISLEVDGCFPHMCQEVEKEVECLVKEFGRRVPPSPCPLGHCGGRVLGGRWSAMVVCGDG